MGAELHCLRGIRHDNGLLDCTSAATGPEKEVHINLKGRYRHPNIYRKGPKAICHSLGTEFDLIIIESLDTDW